MTPELKTKWIEALRSGAYQQDKYKFKTKIGYCCLGVLCEIAGQPSMDMGGSSNYNFVHTLLSDSIINHCEDLNDGKWDDNEGWEIEPQSFHQIADWLEANLEAEPKTSG